MTMRLLLARVLVTVGFISSQLAARVYPEVFDEPSAGIAPLWPFWRE